MNSGRTCPLDYRYPPTVFSGEPGIHAHTIYVIGGLYGNLAALDAVLALAGKEQHPPTLIFNGDFNWFNVNADHFQAINHAVLKHTALRGNVETELASMDDTGCGCAYPDDVDDDVVERSNAIMQKLRHTALKYPQLSMQLSALPMTLITAVGGARIGVVHGDAESLAGWRFGHNALDDEANQAWLTEICVSNNLAGMASSHTCLPALRRFDHQGQQCFIANNGAAGMPNFSGTEYGLLTRISIHAAAEGVSQYGHTMNGIYIDAVPVHYDALAFKKQFLADWPAHSAAYLSYFSRIENGPNYAPANALGLIKSSATCS